MTTGRATGWPHRERDRDPIRVQRLRAHPGTRRLHPGDPGGARRCPGRPQRCKTTLLHLVVGLTAPTAGSITVLGGALPGSNDALQRIGFVAQDTPLYKNLSVADTLRLVANLSPTWDEAHARAHLASLEIPLDRKVGHLSGGQQAQVSLAVALARHPELLVLDEPLARLDPLARHDFMAVLMAAVAEEGISVLFSSHVLAELERVCDYLVVLNHGRVQVAGDVEDLLDSHRILTGPTAEAAGVAASLLLV